MSIYTYICNIAKEKNLDIKTIESACGLSNGSLGKWKVSVPKVDALYKVALYLNMPLEYFLTGVRPETDETENLLIESYRSVDTEGKARIIQVCMNEKDRVEKKTITETSTVAG